MLLFLKNCCQLVQITVTKLQMSDRLKTLTDHMFHPFISNVIIC